MIEATDVLRKTRERRAVYLLLLIVINFALFLPSMSGDFLWDDKYFISENPSILGSGFLRGFLSSPFGGFSGSDENSVKQDRLMQFYRPLVSLSYWLDFKIWGLNSAAFHLTNILIHIANVIILFYLFSGLEIGPRPAFFGAVLFSVFPLHFENVSWISGRTDLLAFLFVGLATLFFMRFIKKRSLPGLLASALACFLALLCKENAIVLPLIFSFFLYKRSRIDENFLPFLGPLALAALGWFLLRWNALGSASITASGRTWPDFLATVGFYGWKTVFPFDLSLTVDTLRVFPSALFRLLGAGILAGLAVSVWQALRKDLVRGWPYWTFMSWVLLLLPSSLVIMSGAAISLVAWRFLYLPSAVMLGALAWLLECRLRPKALTVGAVVILSAFYAAEIYPKNSLFGKDETGFWLSLKETGREDVIARYNIAVKTLPNDEDKARRLFNDILNVPNHPLHEMMKTWIYGDLAIYYALKKDFPKAESYFQQLFETGDRQSLRVYFNYAYYLGLSGEKQRGEELVQKLLRQFPKNHSVLTHAAKFYLIIRDYGKAADLYGEDFRLFRNRQSESLARQAVELQHKAR